MLKIWMSKILTQNFNAKGLMWTILTLKILKLQIINRNFWRINFNKKISCHRNLFFPCFGRSKITLFYFTLNWNF